MKLRFNDLVIKDFKSFSGEHRLKLSDLLTGVHFVRGKNLVQKRLGPNGAGKSSIWDAICWCIFGKTVNGLRNPDVKPWKGSKKTSVTLTIVRGKNNHTIMRSAGPNKLQLDGEDTGQEQIDRLIGMTFEVFTHTVLIGQDQDLFFDLKPTRKLELFSEVLDLDRWDRYSKAAAGKLSDLEDEIMELESRKLGSLLARKEETESILKDMRRKSQTWQAERASKLDRYENEFKSLETDLEQTEAKLTTASLEFDAAEMERKAILESVSKLQQKLGMVDAQISKVEANLSSRKREIRKLEQQREELDTSGICPACGQDVDASAARHHEKEIAAQIDELRKKLDKGIPKKYLDERSGIEEKIQNQGTALLKYNEASKKAQSSIDYFTPKVSDLRAEKKSLLRSIEQFETDKDPYLEQGRKLKAQKLELSKQVKELKLVIAKKNRRYERLKFWVKGFKDVKLHILNELMQELELTTNSMIEEVGLTDWQVRYAIERETKSGSVQRGLTVSILSPENKSPVKWECWSGGEGQRLRVIGALALSEVLLNYAGVSIDLEIIDEPTTYMAGEGVRDVSNFLALRASQLNRRILYVDHQMVESQDFESVITIVKDRKGSRIKCTASQPQC